MSRITRPVWLLSLISLFTDMASEMLYPVMPIYLKTIGFSIVLIGVLEGVAEAVAGLTKGYFGKLSDYRGRRAVFVRAGYSLSAFSKPLLAVSAYPLWIFLARTVDRLGKGIRTGARDALLSDEATPATKGQVFGFHRSMDTLGAVFGPALALLYLWYRPGDYRTLFLLAFLPGLLAVLTSFLLKDKTRLPKAATPPPPLFSFLHYWRQSPALYRKVALGLLIFALFNSSDVFLLLKIKQAGGSDTQVIGVYIFYNLVYALLAYPVGMLADRLGLRRVFIGGLLVFALVYFGMAIQGSILFYAGLFFLYGLYGASTEGISKAWISNISDPKDTATAIGTFAGLQSIAAMLASSLAGLVWYQFGANATFLLTGGMTLLVIAYFLLFIPQRAPAS